MVKYSSRTGVVFDLDDTLYDEQRYVRPVLEEFCRRRRCVDKLPTMTAAVPHIRNTGADLFDGVLRAGMFRGDLAFLREELFEVYTTLSTRIAPYPDALAVLKHLRERGVALGLLTNGVVRAQERKVACLALDGCFDAVVFARQWGTAYEKPHRRPFVAIAELLRVEPDRLLFVGDNPRTDFGGAKEIGARTARVRRGVFHELISDRYVDREVDDLREIMTFV